MARLKELLGMFAESGIPDDFGDQIGGAYDEDIAEATAEAVTSATAQIDELTAANTTISDQLGALQQTLTETQAHNWRLSQAVPDTSGDVVSPEEDGEPDGEARGIDALFGDDDNEDKEDK